MTDDELSMCAVCKMPQSAHYRLREMGALRCGQGDDAGFYWSYAERRRVTVEHRRKFIEAYILAGCRAGRAPGVWEAAEKWRDIERDEDEWLSSWTPPEKT